MSVSFRANTPQETPRKSARFYVSSTLKKMDVEMRELERGTAYRESNFGILMEDLERGSFQVHSQARASTAFKGQFCITDDTRSVYEEDEAGNVPVAHNSGLEQQDASDEGKGDEDAGHASVNRRPVNAINAMLFGGGKCIAVPIGWILIQFSVFV